MAPTLQSVVDGCVYTCSTLLRVLYETFVGMVKALLPVGVLPRKSVAGQVVLVTGSGSQMGRLMAIEFGKLGARVVLWDVNESTNMETKKLVEEQGAEAYAYTVNLLNREDIYSTARRVKADVGAVNILVNNAGVVTGHSLLESSDEAIERTMAVNTNAVIFTTKAFLGEMLESNHGHVVMMSSMAGLRGIAGLTDYCASKFAVVGFAEALMAELYAQKKDGVHVTTICPFFIDTGMFDGVKTKCPTLLPILKPQYVVDRIMEAVLTNRESLILPKFCYIAPALGGILPYKACVLLSDYLGLYNLMDEFVGRSKTEQ